jgi:hypothetical protein
MAKAKKVVKKRATRAVKPKAVQLSWRNKLQIKLLVAKAQLNIWWHLLKAKMRGY